MEAASLCFINYQCGIHYNDNKFCFDKIVACLDRIGSFSGLQEHVKEN